MGDYNGIPGLRSKAQEGTTLSQSFARRGKAAERALARTDGAVERRCAPSMSSALINSGLEPATATAKMGEGWPNIFSTSLDRRQSRQLNGLCGGWTQGSRVSRII